MAEEKKELPNLDCQLTDLDPDVQPKTVGDLFELKCTGSGLLDQPLTDKTKVGFEQEGLDYALHIVEVKKAEAAEFIADVTCYLPSAYSNQSFLLIDGEAQYKVNGLTWQYESVLQKAEQHQKETLVPPPEKLEPYPYYGPIEISYPVWIWVGLGIFATFLIGLLFRWQTKRMQKQRLVEAALSGMGSALTPYQAFNKSLRQVLRQTGSKNVNSQEILEDLNKAFRVYLTRALTVPAFDWSEAEILKDIRNHHRNVYKDNGRQILRLLREFERARGQSIKRQDVEQMLELSRKTVEEIDRHKVRIEKGGLR